MNTAGPTERELSADLVALFDAYQAATGFEMSTISQRLAGDWRFYNRLKEAAATFTLRKFDQVVANFAAEWPPKARWPKSVPRPKTAVVS